MSSRMPGRGEPLSDREVQVLRLMADGWSNAEIGERLVPKLSDLTVKSHLARITRKLDARSRAHLVGLAAHLGLLGELPPSPDASGGVSAAAVELLLALAEQMAAGRPLFALRRGAVEALTAAGRRGPGGRPLVSSQGQRVSP